MWITKHWICLWIISFPPYLSHFSLPYVHPVLRTPFTSKFPSYPLPFLPPLLCSLSFVSQISHRSIWRMGKTRGGEVIIFREETPFCISVIHCFIVAQFLWLRNCSFWDLNQGYKVFFFLILFVFSWMFYSCNQSRSKSGSYNMNDQILDTSGTWIIMRYLSATVDNGCLIVSDMQTAPPSLLPTTPAISPHYPLPLPQPSRPSHNPTTIPPPSTIPQPSIIHVHNWSPSMF